MADNKALLLASASGKSNQVTALLAAGADVKARNDQGETALMLACGRRGYVVSVETAVAIAKALLAAGAEVNAKDAAGYTALMHACSTIDNGEVIELLLDNGADITVVSEGGNTAYDLADAQYRNPKPDWLKRLRRPAGGRRKKSRRNRNRRRRGTRRR